MSKSRIVALTECQALFTCGRTTALIEYHTPIMTHRTAALTLSPIMCDRTVASTESHIMPGRQYYLSFLVGQ